MESLRVSTWMARVLITRRVCSGEGLVLVAGSLVTLAAGCGWLCVGLGVHSSVWERREPLTLKSFLANERLLRVAFTAPGLGEACV